MSVVLVLGIQVSKEVAKIFAVFCNTEMNVLKEVLREVLEVVSVEIILPEKSLGRNTVIFSSFKWILLWREGVSSPPAMVWVLVAMGKLQVFNGLLQPWLKTGLAKILVVRWMSDVLKTNTGSNFNNFLLSVCYLDLFYASFWKDHFFSRIDVLD